MTALPKAASIQLLFDIAPIAMVLLGEGGKVLKINKAALREFDVTRKNALKKPLVHFFPAVEQERLEDFLDTARKLSQRSPHEVFQGKTRNSGPRFVEISASPLEDKQLLVVFHNVTKTVWLIGKEEEARLRVEETARRLARAEYRLQMALEAGQMGIWEMDLNAKTLGWTLGLHPITDAFHSQSITAQEFLTRIHPVDRERVTKLIRQAQKKELKFTQEYRVKSSRGGYLWILSRGSAVDSGNGGRILSGVWLDITERKIIETRVRAQYEVNRVLARGMHPRASIEKVLKIIGESLNFDLGIVWKYEEGEFKWFGHWKADPKNKFKLEEFSKKITFKKGEYFIGNCTEVTWVRSTGESAYVYKRKAPAMADGFDSVVAFPVYVGQDIRFVLEYYGRDDLRENKEIAKMLTLLGSQLGQYMGKVETQEQLATSKAQLEAIFQSVTDGIAVQNAKGEVIYANDAAAKMAGYREPQMLVEAGEKTLEKFEIIGEGGDRFEPAMFPGRKVLKTKRPASAVIGYKASFGNGEKWVLIKASPVLDSEGKIQLAVNVIHDITSNVLEQKSRDLFLGIASHELKTPIAVVKAFAQLASRRIPDNAPPELSEYLTKINDQVDYLTGLIGDLMDATRIRAGKFVLVKRDFNLDELLNETVKNVQLTSSAHEIIKSGKAPRIHADPARMSQVLINLLRNAIKYSPGKSKVLVRASYDKENLTIAVQDFGIGIAKSHQKLLFKPMYRIENHATISPKGLGLGLFISAAIVEGHGGKISLESKVGEGSTFKVILPRVQS